MGESTLEWKVGATVPMIVGGQKQSVSRYKDIEQLKIHVYKFFHADSTGAAMLPNEK